MHDAGLAANITVFERSSYIGGRTTTVHAWGDPYTSVELGGSIFVEVNHILVNASKEFNLSSSSFDRAAPENAPELGIWTGHEFVVKMENSLDGWWEKAKLLWRYGLAPIKTNSLMKSTVAKFLQMYEEPLFPWTSLNDAVESIGLKETVALTGEQFLQKNGIGAKFAWEIIQAATRVNYASNIGLIHGLETMVCMATNGAMAIEGGNWQIFANMLKASGASAQLETNVTHISKEQDGTYQLTVSDGSVSTFDTIVLAAPLQFSNLVIDPAPQHVPDQIPYVNLYTTLFASPHVLDPAAFNLAPGENTPQFVLTTLAPDEDYGSDPAGVGAPGFFSLSIVGDGLNPNSPKNRPEYIYKIFAPVPVTSAFLSKILGQDVNLPSEISSGEESGKTGQVVGDGSGPVSWIHRKLWQSYPYEYPRVTFDEIKLDEGFYYTSGIESFISTMETSALMGKNVARLVVDEWMREMEVQRDAEPELAVKGESTAGVDWEFEGLETQQKQEEL